MPLSPGRSLAVDRSLWPYGLPVWLDGTLPTPEGVSRATTRTVVVASLAVLGLDFLLTALMFSV